MPAAPAISLDRHADAIAQFDRGRPRRSDTIESMTLLTPEQRLQLINSAPGTHGDHVVGIDSALHAVVRVDGLGRRIVALGSSPAEAIERAKPKVASPTEVDARTEAQRGSRRRKGAALYKRKIDAEAFAAELAEYRRAVAAVGIETPELL
jgi:hypothetical protein